MNLTANVVTFFGFVRGLWGTLPAEVTQLLWFSIKASVFYSVIRAFVH